MAHLTRCMIWMPMMKGLLMSLVKSKIWIPSNLWNSQNSGTLRRYWLARYWMRSHLKSRLIIPRRKSCLMTPTPSMLRDPITIINLWEVHFRVVKQEVPWDMAKSYRTNPSRTIFWVVVGWTPTGLTKVGRMVTQWHNLWTSIDLSRKDKQ